MAITLMILDKHFAAVNQIRSLLSFSLTPVQYVVSWPIHLVDHIQQTFSTHDGLIKENLDLKAQQLLLKAQVQRLMAIESENNQLKALLRSSSQFQGKMAIAQILAVDTDPLIHQIVLDKGSHDNVYIGQPVLDANGIMGQIIQVGPISSRVLLVSDPQCGIPVRNARNGVRAIAVGDGYTGRIRLTNVTHTTDIVVGDKFVTSGLGQNYPEGYPVGQVINVLHDPASAFATIQLEPCAHLDRGRQVLLAWPNKTGADHA